MFLVFQLLGIFSLSAILVITGTLRDSSTQYLFVILANWPDMAGPTLTRIRFSLLIWLNKLDSAKFALVVGGTATTIFWFWVSTLPTSSRLPPPCCSSSSFWSLYWERSRRSSSVSDCEALNNHPLGRVIKLDADNDNNACYFYWIFVVNAS